MSTITHSHLSAKVVWDSSPKKASREISSDHFIDDASWSSSSLKKVRVEHGTNIRKVLPKIKTFAALRPIAEQAEIHLSLWRGRHIVVNGYKGSLHLGALTTCFYNILNRHSTFDYKEDQHKKAIQQRINLIYKKSNEKLEKSHFLKQLMINLSEEFYSLTSFLKNIYTG